MYYSKGERDTSYSADGSNWGLYFLIKYGSLLVHYLLFLNSNMEKILKLNSCYWRNCQVLFECCISIFRDFDVRCV